MKKLLLFLTSLIIVVPVFVSGCKSAVELDGPGSTSDGKLTVEEASAIIGLPVPVPTFLPAGYQIISVQLEANGMPNGWNITITMENSRTPREISPGTVTLEVRSFSLGLKVPGERVKIGDSMALVRRNPEYIGLLWVDKTGRQLSLTGNKELQFEDLVKMAASVTTPPGQILDSRLDPDADLVVLRGQSQRLKIHLQNNSSKSLEVSVSQDTDLPKSIGIKVLDSSLTLKPRQSVDILVDAKIDTDAPSPTWPYKPASSVMPTDIPPPIHSITEDPSYYLRFVVSYQYSTYINTPVQDHISLGVKLRIDAPSELPSGMVTLQEAEDAADFPVALLLPSYFPGGTNPVPVGYGISNEEPHSITVFYSALRVILSPERGISEPPASYTGERTIIRKKPVVIGQDRIDWWVYDIHFSVISDEIPMSELKLVAESMMLIGVYSESWLGQGQ
jgi:hypothetical protein